MSPSSPEKKPKPVTPPDLLRWKSEGRKITSLTAYDHTMALLLDQAGIDVILVGDSLGTVVQGRDSTLPVTLEQSLYHTEMVARAARRALVVGDLPFLTYQASVEQAIMSAGRFLKETGCGAIKLEGGRPMAATIRALVDIGIPVMGHVGLTPQSVRRFGGNIVQRDGESILADARAVADSGAFAIVLECIPGPLAATITAEMPIPTIGIGAVLNATARCSSPPTCSASSNSSDPASPAATPNSPPPSAKPPPATPPTSRKAPFPAPTKLTVDFQAQPGASPHVEP